MNPKGVAKLYALSLRSNDPVTFVDDFFSQIEQFEEIDFNKLLLTFTLLINRMSCSNLPEPHIQNIAQALDKAIISCVNKNLTGEAASEREKYNTVLGILLALINRSGGEVVVKNEEMNEDTSLMFYEDDLGLMHVKTSKSHAGMVC